MVLREPVFDNPIESSKLPRSKPEFSFPALIYKPDCDQVNHLVAVAFTVVVFASILVCLGRAPAFKDAFDSGTASSLASLGIMTLTAAIILRPFLRFPLLPEAVSVIGLLATLLVLASIRLDLHLLPTVSALVLIWGTSELALHWVVINPIADTGSRLDPRYVVVTAGASLLIWLAKEGIVGPQQVPVTLIITTLLLTAALTLHYHSGYHLKDLICVGFAGFYGYPDATAPGVMRAPSGHSMLRPLPAITFLFASIGDAIFNVTAAGTAEIFLRIACAVVLELAIFTLVVVISTTPASRSSSGQHWREAVAANARSSDPVLRNSIYAGRVASDGSPVLLDTSLVLQHVHFMGATGEGKSSMGMVPLIEQLGARGDVSIIAMDLKGDSNELLAALDVARGAAVRRTHKDIPLKVFSTEEGRLTHAFNPLLTQGWSELSILDRTDVITSALGLNYGTGYGRDFFTSCNSVVIESGNRLNPDSMSLRQLHTETKRFLQSKAARDLMPDIRRTGFHAQSVLSRMALLDAINVTGARPDAPDVLENQIDLAQFFSTPTFAYFQLPSPTSSIVAPAVARLALHFLLVAGKKVKRNHKVYVFIDEFQRMAAHGLEMMFQMARSLDVGLILANHSMNDMVAVSPSLASTMEENCHWRQWFTVKTKSELEYLEKVCGTKEETRKSESVSAKGRVTTAQTVEVPRMTVQDLLYVSNDPHLSIMHITGDRKGFGQYRGMPFVVRNDFHISEDEFLNRKRFAWPDGLPGMFRGGTTTNTENSTDAFERDLSDERELADVNLRSDAAWQPDLFE